MGKRSPAWDRFDEKKADKQSQAFLEQCRREGKITAEEMAEISPHKDASGDTPSPHLIRFAEFVQTVCRDMGWPEEDAERCLNLRLEQVKLTPQHVELYLNYPAWTEQELAKEFGFSQQQVSYMLKRVRKAFPGLRFDTTKKYGVPNLKDMKRLDYPIRDSESSWDETSDVIKF